jgi:acyl carrier protein
MEALEDLETFLWKHLAEYHLPPNSDSYENDENLFDAGILDSAGLISFITFIEHSFDLTIPDEDLLPKYFSSVSAIASYIRSRKMEDQGRAAVQQM